jgi:hypothetical protein
MRMRVSEVKEDTEHTRAKFHCDVGSPDFNQCLQDLDGKPGAVLRAAAPFVSPLVRVEVEKLLHEVAVRSVHWKPIRNKYLRNKISVGVVHSTPSNPASLALIAACLNCAMNTVGSTISVG